MAEPTLTQIPAYYRHLLPQFAQDLAQGIGLQATLILCEVWGGRRLYIPAKLKSQHYLCGLLGPVAAERLAQIYGGDTPTIPRCAQALRAALYADIAEQYHGGRSAATLAAEHHCTERWIYYLVAQQRDCTASPQQALL